MQSIGNEADDRRTRGTPARFPEPSLRPDGSPPAPASAGAQTGDLVVFIGSDTGGSEVRRLGIRANGSSCDQGGDLC